MMEVGDVVYNDLPHMGVPEGAPGYVFDVYDGGVQIIWPNGEYCGYSEEEMKEFLLHTNGELEVRKSYLKYEFSNVMILSRDYRKGVFDRAFAS